MKARRKEVGRRRRQVGRLLLVPRLRPPVGSSKEDIGARVRRRRQPKLWGGGNLFKSQNCLWEKWCLSPSQEKLLMNGGVAPLHATALNALSSGCGDRGFLLQLFLPPIVSPVTGESEPTEGCSIPSFQENLGSKIGVGSRFWWCRQREKVDWQEGTV